jgi:hypothetical protein
MLHQRDRWEKTMTDSPAQHVRRIGYADTGGSIYDGTSEMPFPSHLRRLRCPNPSASIGAARH